MASQSDLTTLTPEERRDYGFARVRDAAFDAVSSLWERRQAEGMTQADLAVAIEADSGWVSRNLRGPGNWTMRTFGALVEALRGEAQISVRALEDVGLPSANYHAYVDYEPTTLGIVGSPTALTLKDLPPVSVSSKPKRTISAPLVTTLIS